MDPSVFLERKHSGGTEKVLLIWVSIYANLASMSYSITYCNVTIISLQ
jgi:hypothetical protein